MKQNITDEQFNELDKKQKRIWRRFQGFGYDNFPCQPSIGQMMEFLGENWRGSIIAGWHKNVGNGCLCDLLWEAVKNKLNE